MLRPGAWHPVLAVQVCAPRARWRPAAVFEPCLAKFPGHNDQYDWGSWEYLIYLLAGDAGIGMPPAKRVLLSDRYHTYCVSQFDRQAGAAGAAQGRRMYASAMTLLERRDGQEGGSYLHLIEALESCGGVGLTDDMHQLF